MFGSLGTTMLGVLFPVSIAAAIFISGVIVAAKRTGPVTLMTIGGSLRANADSASGGLAITLGLWFLLYCVFYVRAADRNTTALHQSRIMHMEVDQARTRMRNLLTAVARIPLEREQSLMTFLTEIGSHSVKIRYVTADTSGAIFVASQLEKIFRQARWTVELEALIGEHPYLDPLSMKISPQSPLPEPHRRLLDALNGAGIRCGHLSDGAVLQDTVELFVGNISGY